MSKLPYRYTNYGDKPIYVQDPMNPYGDAKKILPGETLYWHNDQMFRGSGLVCEATKETDGPMADPYGRYQADYTGKMDLRYFEPMRVEAKGTFIHTSTPLGSNWLIDEILSYAQPDTDTEEEAAEQVPDDTTDACCAQAMEQAEYWEREAAHWRKRLDESENRFDEWLEQYQVIERDISRIRQAIGEQRMNEILGTELETVADEEIRLTERRSKWLGR